MRFAFLVVLISLSLLPSLAAASDHAPLAPERGSTEEMPHILLSAGLGGGRYADDGVMGFRPGFHVRLNDARLGKSGRLFGMDNAAPFALDVVAPMHFTLVDRGIDDAFWRGSEYNQASEFLSILRRLEYGRLDGPLYVKVGSLSGVRLGHGTVLDRYATNYGFDYRRWGAHLTMQSPTAGGSFVLDDVVQPGLVGGRIFIAPWAKSLSAARSMAFGVTLLGDFSAPTALGANPDGTLQFDRFRQPEVADTQSVGMLGFDFEAQAVDTARTRMTFYTDLNLFFPGSSLGWHTGAFLGWKSGDVSVFSLRGEFRLAGNGYMPGYFSKAYEVSRSRVAASFTAPQTMRQLRDTHAVGGLRTGYQASVRWDHTKIGRMEAGVEGGSGHYDESLFLEYASPDDYIVRFALRYELPWIASWKRVQLFEQSVVSAELQVALTPWLVVWGQGGRRWRQSEGFDFTPQTEVQAGATFYYAFPR